MEAPLVLALEALGLGCELLRSDYNTSPKCGPGKRDRSFQTGSGHCHKLSS